MATVNYYLLGIQSIKDHQRNTNYVDIESEYFGIGFQTKTLNHSPYSCYTQLKPNYSQNHEY